VSVRVSRLDHSKISTEVAELGGESVRGPRLCSVRLGPPSPSAPRAAAPMDPACFHESPQAVSAVRPAPCGLKVETGQKHASRSRFFGVFWDEPHAPRPQTGANQMHPNPVGYAKELGHVFGVEVRLGTYEAAKRALAVVGDRAARPRAAAATHQELSSASLAACCFTYS
jgi:hypothetical protein